MVCLVLCIFSYFAFEMLHVGALQRCVCLSDGAARSKWIGGASGMPGSGAEKSEHQDSGVDVTDIAAQSGASSVRSSPADQRPPLDSTAVLVGGASLIVGLKFNVFGEPYDVSTSDDCKCRQNITHLTDGSQCVNNE